MADWLIIGMFAGFRLSEWAVSSSYWRKHNQFPNNRDGSPTAFTRSDIRFHNDNKGAYVSITWRFQKNNNNGEVITFAKNLECPARCPYMAMKRIVDRATRMKLDPYVPLAWYRDNGINLPITDFEICTVLRLAASVVHLITDKDDLSRWSAHSIRVGACVALHASGADSITLKQRLRWRSDTFLMYLRNTPHLALAHTLMMSNL
jgi:hypothetical protein